MANPDRGATERDRMAVVRALAAARRSEQLSVGDQAERTETALAAATIGELESLVADLSDPPVLPLAGISRRVALAAGGTAAVAAVTALVWPDEPDDVAATSDVTTPEPTPTTSAASAVAPTTTAPPKPPDLHSVRGLRRFIDSYHREFGTWFAYELSADDDGTGGAHSVYGPLAKRRLQWWSWDVEEGWNTIFDPAAAASTEQPIDLRRVNVPAAVEHVKVARRTLGVEDVSGVYLAVRTWPTLGSVVMISASNDFSESGHLMTDLGGRILTRRPFTRS